MGQKLKYLQAVFNKGELSPRLKGRVDNQGYYKAYDSATNMLPYPEGAITYRPGFVYVNEVKNSANNSIVVGFRFSTVQNYVIEFGDQYVRFYRNRGLIESGGSPYEVSTPYAHEDLYELNFFQSADVLYILHPDYQPRKLTRTSDTNWTLTTLNFTDGPYYPINSTATTLSRSGTTVTASTSIFTSGDVGRQIRMKDGSAWSTMEITAYSSGTSVTVDTSGSISSTTDWRLGAFGGNQGWPKIGTIFEERLMLGNTVSLPSTVWGSVTGEFENFAPSDPDDGEVLDDSGFSFTIGDDQVNAINWFSSGRQLLIGTTGAEHSLTGGTSSGYAPITPTNVTIKRETNFGSKENIKPIRIGNAVLYASQSGRKVREMYYEFGIDSYISRDVTLFSENITRGGIVQMTYVQEPDPYLWACTEDGQLIGMVYDRLQEIEGWHKHSVAGVDAKVVSLTQIPRPGTEEDDLWAVVERTVNGNTVKYIEYLSEIYEEVRAPLDDAPDRFYSKHLDSCITYDGYYDANITLGATTGTGVTVTASTGVFSSGDVGSRIKANDGNAVGVVATYNSATEVEIDITGTFTGTSYTAGNWSMQSKEFSGLAHLEGETVSIVADGYVTDDETVASGALSIEQFASVVHVGLKYTANLRFLLVEFPQLGTIQGREKSVSRVHLFLTDTYGLSVKDVVSGEVIPIKFLNLPLQTDGAQPLLNGLMTFHPPSGYERDSQLELVHDIPLPFTLNYIVQDLDVNA